MSDATDEIRNAVRAPRTIGPKRLALVLLMHTAAEGQLEQLPVEIRDHDRMLLCKADVRSRRIWRLFGRCGWRKDAVFLAAAASRCGLENRLHEFATIALFLGARRFGLIEGSDLRWHSTIPAIFRMLLSMIADIPITLALLAGAAAAKRRHLAAAPAAAGTERPSIAYLWTSQAPEGHIGGSASHAIGTVQGMIDAGCPVSVFTTRPSLCFGDRQVAVRELAAPSFAFFWWTTYIRFGLRCWWQLRNSPPDIVYQRHRRFDISGALLSWLLSRPLFLHYEGSEALQLELWDPSRLGWPIRLFEAVNHGRASAMFVMSEAMREDLVRRRHIEPHKITVTPSRVDIDAFRPGVGGREIRRELTISDDVVVIGFSGTFGPWHGLKTIVEAIRLLPAANLEFLFIGSGGESDLIRAELKAGPHRSHFIGLVPFQSMPRYMDACDIVLCPAATVGGVPFFCSPTKLLEAMASGKAVVATALGDANRLVRDGRTGLLVAPERADEVADAILALARDPRLRERLGRSARQSVLDGETWAMNGRAIAQAADRARSR